MLGTRIVTAIVGGTVFLALLWLGGLAWTALWVVLAAIGSFEYARILQAAGHRLPWPVLVIGAAALTGLGFFWVDGAPPLWYLIVWQAALLTCLSLPLWQEAYDFRTGAFALAALVYTGWLPATIVGLGQLGRGAALAFWLAVWLTDIGAYFGGRLFGRQKLLPRISPGKTRAGAISGTVAAVVTVWACAAWLASLGGFVTGWPAAAFALGVSVLGQIGDLVESVLKRYGGVKDSGRLLPGHGGVLDRFDSALFAAPLAYAMLVLLAR